MKITVIRKFFSQGYTIGDMLINDKFFCNTLEDRVRDEDKSGYFDGDEEKVYGETAIPFGKYKVTLTFSNHFKRILPLIHNVPEFSGVRIHRGNIPKDTLGCILLGENKKKGMVLNSTQYEKKIVDLMDGDNNIELEII